MAKAAVEAFARFAVVAAQLEQGLAGERIAARYAPGLEEADYRILLARQALQYVYGGLLHVAVAIAAAIGIDDRDDDVDYECVDGIAPQGGADTAQRLSLIHI